MSMNKKSNMETLIFSFKFCSPSYFLPGHFVTWFFSFVQVNLELKNLQNNNSNNNPTFSFSFFLLYHTPIYSWDTNKSNRKKSTTNTEGIKGKENSNNNEKSYTTIIKYVKLQMFFKQQLQSVKEQAEV